MFEPLSNNLEDLFKLESKYRELYDLLQSVMDEFFDNIDLESKIRFINDLTKANNKLNESYDEFMNQKYIMFKERPLPLTRTL